MNIKDIFITFFFKACHYSPVSSTVGLYAVLLITSGAPTVSDSEHKAAIVCVCVSGCASEWSRGINQYNLDVERMSPLQASIVNTCLIDSDRDRKGALNSCQCLGVSKTAVDSQGRSG